jgi:hypothetical protein
MWRDQFPSPGVHKGLSAFCCHGARYGYKWLVSETSESEFSELWHPAPHDRLDKLGVSLDDGSNETGFDVRKFPASTWLIHAMYERDMESPLSHDAREMQQIADGERSPDLINGVDLSATTTSTGVGLGWSRAPSAPYKRVRWRDYAERMSVPILRDGYWPGINGLVPSVSGAGSWPENVNPPGEGSIDEDSWTELIRVLVAHSPEAAQTKCTAYYTPWALFPNGAPFLLSGKLGDAGALIDNPTSGGSPQNFWPDDLEWFVYTDFDLQASRISGSVELIAALLADADLDCENLPGIAK